MLISVPDVLSKEQVRQCREHLDRAEWVDGRTTAGYQGAKVKNNQQLPEDSESARKLGDFILSALERNSLFISAALPARVYPPMFNRYAGGQTFGAHIDNAVRLIPGTGLKIRTDVSGTLFLSEPAEYEGGELVIEDTYGTQEVKLPAGHMVLYPGTSLHRVNPVTSGVRTASFFWVQSMVREDSRRALLFDLDTAIQRLNNSAEPESQALLQLTGCYHNLLRMWAET
ncbi:MAG TPA: Fe2+-dependent dioxygenase [Burkholderiales bacterium]|nr:Fe2+-dependent dioxygenase [Burkholderiales bacterium]